MKKRTFIFLLTLLCGLCFSGCSFLYQEKPSSSEPPVQTVSSPKPVKPTPTPKPVLPTPEPFEKNSITGIPVERKEWENQRSVAVMVDNSPDALPQYGISEADLLLEIPVEGGITRLMAVYSNLSEMPSVCPVRSARYYFPVFAAGWDAFFVHWGADQTMAQPLLQELDLECFDGLANPYGLFTRDLERRGYPLEHIGVFSGEKFDQVLSENGLRKQLQVHRRQTIFDFNKYARTPEGESCLHAEVQFSYITQSGFSYQPQSRVYYKSFSGEDHRDGKTGKNLCFDNLLLLEASFTQQEEKGRLEMDWTGETCGTGWYLSRGKVQPITWEKQDAYSLLEVKQEGGELLYLNPGKTYISFSPQGTIILEKTAENQG